MQASGENYLETVWLLKQKKETVRSVDVAEALGYSKPSVCRAMSLLKEEGCIVMDKAGHIELTPKGDALAEAIYEKHTVLTEFLVRFAGVSGEKAQEDACRIEHVISEESFLGLKNYLIKNRRRTGGGMHQRR